MKWYVQYDISYCGTFTDGPWELEEAQAQLHDIAGFEHVFNARLIPEDEGKKTKPRTTIPDIVVDAEYPNPYKNEEALGAQVDALETERDVLNAEVSALKLIASATINARLAEIAWTETAQACGECRMLDLGACDKHASVLMTVAYAEQGRDVVVDGAINAAETKGKVVK